MISGPTDSSEDSSELPEQDTWYAGLRDLLGNPWRPAEPEEIEAFQARFSFDYCPSFSDFYYLGYTEASYQYCMNEEQLAVATTSALPDVSAIEDLAFCYDSLVLLDENGNTYVWGGNAYGMLGDGTNIYRHLPYRLNLDLRDVFVGTSNMFAVGTDGALYGWGCNLASSLGLGELERYTPHFAPEKVPFDLPVREVRPYEWTTVLLTEEGEVYRAGIRVEEFQSQAGAALDFWFPDYSMAGTFEKLETPERMVSVANSGTGYAMAGESGKVYFLGLLGMYNQHQELTEIAFPEPIQRVWTTWNCVLALGKSNTLYGYGYRDDSLTLFSKAEYGLTEKPIALFSNVRDVSPQLGHVFVITLDGECYAWGHNCDGKLGLGERGRTPHPDPEIAAQSDCYFVAEPMRVAFPEPIVKVECGGSSSVALGESGQVYFWGRDSMNLHLEPGFTPESVKDIPFEARVGPEWTVYEPIALGTSIHSEK